MDWISDLKSKIRGRIDFDSQAREWTWLKVGGKPLFTFFPAGVEDLKLFMKLRPKNVPFRTFGAASNVLIRDNGYEGVFVKLAKEFREITISETDVKIGLDGGVYEVIQEKDQLEQNSQIYEVIVGAGMLGKTLVEKLLEKNLGGIAFLATIPGMIGGLIKMNAGAHGQEIKDIVNWVEFMDSSGEIHKISLENCNFQYRKSGFQNSDIILRAGMKCIMVNSAKEAEKIESLLEHRKKTQPISGKMAGCFFKNPTIEDFTNPAILANFSNIPPKAWEIIKKSNFPDSENVKISPIHANFIMNSENATALEIETFVQNLQNNIFSKYGIWLKTEIEILGKK